ncbi:MAG: shikimate kinase [Planctomycetota bacterium]
MSKGPETQPPGASFDRIALVGPRATGKSAVGRCLAELSGRAFLDLDECLADRAGAAEADTAGELLERLGEERFRDLEEEALEAADQDARERSAGIVLACGGGVLLREANRKRLAAPWTVVYLRTPALELRRRLEEESESAARPPLLAGSASAAAEIESILEARESAYVSASDFIVDCVLADEKSVANRVHELCPSPPRSSLDPPPENRSGETSSGG